MTPAVGMKLIYVGALPIVVYTVLAIGKDGTMFVEWQNAKGEYYYSTVHKDSYYRFEEYKEPRKKTFKFSVIEGIGAYKDVGVFAVAGDYPSNNFYKKIDEFEYEWTEKV